MTRCSDSKVQRTVRNGELSFCRESRAKQRDTGNINFNPIAEINEVDDLQEGGQRRGKGLDDRPEGNTTFRKGEEKDDQKILLLKEQLVEFGE